MLSKIKKAYSEGRLIPALKTTINPYLRGLKYVVYDPASNNVVLHSPDYIEPSKDTSEMEVVKRIFFFF